MKKLSNDLLTIRIAHSTKQALKSFAKTQNISMSELVLGQLEKLTVIENSN